LAKARAGGGNDGLGGVWAPGVDAIYFGAAVGFVAAGLAVLGVRPLRRFTPWDAIVAGACSLLSYAVLGDRGLWAGPMVSLVLAVAVTAWARGRRPRETPRPAAGGTAPVMPWVSPSWRG
jgi:hypothetical protein